MTSIKAQGLISKVRTFNGFTNGDLIMIGRVTRSLLSDELKAVSDEVRRLTGDLFEATLNNRGDLVVWTVGEPVLSGDEEERRMVALGLRAVACPQWRWMPGMLAYYPVKPYQAYLRYASAQVDEGEVWARGVPDLRDKATIGCLLDMIGPTRTSPPHWMTHWQFTGDLAEALVSGLEFEAERFLLKHGEDQKRDEEDEKRDLEAQQAAVFAKEESVARLDERSQDFLDGRRAALVEVSEMVGSRVQYNCDNGLWDKHRESLMILNLVSNMIDGPSRAFTAGVKACVKQVLTFFEQRQIFDDRRAAEPAQSDEDLQGRQCLARESSQVLKQLRFWASHLRL